MDVTKSPQWTAAQRAYLDRQYAQTPTPLLCARLGRSPGAIRMAAQRAGLTRRNGCSVAELAEAVGCSPQTVRRWILRGWLRAKCTRSAPGPGPRWYVPDRAVTAFLAAHPARWRKYSVPPAVWNRVNARCAPGSPAWIAALAPYPPPGAAWLRAFEGR